jgi:hypothetical protein
MNKKLWLWAAVGALVGAAGVQTAHVVGDRNSRELFSQRLRCKALADKYVKDRYAVGGTVVLSRVEFSRRRGSCIASTSEQLGRGWTLSPPPSWGLCRSHRTPCLC